MTAGLRHLRALERAKRARICAHGKAQGAVRAYAFTLAEAPERIKLWNAGDNPTDFGVHRWTARSVRAVMGRYEARGNPIQIDVEHNNASVAPDGSEPQGGYATLVLEAGEPWLVFDWSAYALEQIATKQRRFLSPEYDIDKTTGEILALIRVSLVADPATHHARQLARARILANTQNGVSPMPLALLLAALKAAASAEDPEAAKTQIQALIAEVEKAAGGEAAPAGEPDGDEPAPAVATAAAPADAPPAPAEGAKPKDEDEKMRAAAAARRITPAGATPGEIALAQNVASVLAKNAAELGELRERDAARSKRELELEATARVAAAGEKIPDALRPFARGLSAADFATFVAGLPDAKPGTTPKRVNAAARPAQHAGADLPPRPEGELDTEDRRVMARVFNLAPKNENPVTFLPDGRVRLSVLAQPKAAVAAKGGV